MYLVLLAAAVAILAGVVAVAMGGGGELAISRRDLPVIPPRIRTASDLARLRLPLGLFGYQTDSADEVLQVLASHLAERDAEIARLRQEVQWLGAQRNGSASATMPPLPPGRPVPPRCRAAVRRRMPRDRTPSRLIAELPPDAELPDAESPLPESLAEFPGPEFPATRVAAVSKRSRWRAAIGTELRGAAAGPDGQPRCPWSLGTPDYLDYHDQEWGRRSP